MNALNAEIRKCFELTRARIKFAKSASELDFVCVSSLIHTRCCGLQIPQWTVALCLRDRIIPISASKHAHCGIRTSVNEPLIELAVKYTYLWSYDIKYCQFCSFTKIQVGMELHLSRVHSDDFGHYKCIAKNPRGQTDGDITLTGLFTISVTRFGENSPLCIILKL